MITAARRKYMKKYYQDHKEKMDSCHTKYMSTRRVRYKKPQPNKELTEVNCIGTLCWPKGLTFMSPDPIRIRICNNCLSFTEGRNP